jgi:hypothetical protein
MKPPSAHHLPLHEDTRGSVSFEEEDVLYVFFEATSSNELFFKFLLSLDDTVPYSSVLLRSNERDLSLSLSRTPTALLHLNLVVVESFRNTVAER